MVEPAYTPTSHVGGLKPCRRIEAIPYLHQHSVIAFRLGCVYTWGHMCVFGPLKNWVISLCVVGIIYIFWIWVYFHIYMCDKYLFSVHGLFYYSLNSVFWWIEFLHFNEVQFIHLFLWLVVFWSGIWEIFTQGSWRYPLMFSSRSFTVSHLGLWTMSN